jgi:hypothetical protein
MSRIRSLDLARGFTVLCIPAIHSMLLYSQSSVRTSVMGYLLKGIAEGPGAQLFLCLMGMYLAFSESIDRKQILKKALLLLLGGYALNALKFVLPFEAGVIPQELLSDLQMANDSNAWWRLLLIGDILQCAAICLVFIYVVRQCRRHHLIALLLASMIMIVGPWTWEWQVDNLIVSYGWQLFNGRPPQVFFPLFPWLVYPLCGVAIGYYLRINEKETFDWLREISLILLMLYIVYRCIVPGMQPASFYRTAAPETLFHVAVVLITLYVWHWLDGHVQRNHFFMLLEYSSKRITRLYIIQWIVIMWLLPVTGYQEHELGVSTVLSIFTTGLTYIFSCIIDAYKEFASIHNK